MLYWSCFTPLNICNTDSLNGVAVRKTTNELKVTLQFGIFDAKGCKICKIIYIYDDRRSP